MTTDNTQVLLFDYNNIQTDEFIDSVAKSVIAEQDDIRSKYKWTSSWKNWGFPLGLFASLLIACMLGALSTLPQVSTFQSILLIAAAFAVTMAISGFDWWTTSYRERLSNLFDNRWDKQPAAGYMTVSNINLCYFRFNAGEDLTIDVSPATLVRQFDAAIEPIDLNNLPEDVHPNFIKLILTYKSSVRYLQEVQKVRPLRRGDLVVAAQNSYMETIVSMISNCSYFYRNEDNPSAALADRVENQTDVV